MALSPKDHVGDIVVKFLNVTKEGSDGLAQTYGCFFVQVVRPTCAIAGSADYPPEEACAAGCFPVCCQFMPHAAPNTEGADGLRSGSEAAPGFGFENDEVDPFLDHDGGRFPCMEDVEDAEQEGGGA